MNRNVAIPLPVYIFAFIIFGSGLMGFYAGFFNPSLFFEFLPNVDWDASNLPFLNGLWGTRNLSVALVMLLAIVMRNAIMMFTVFLIRLLIELQDVLILAPTKLDLTGFEPPTNPTLFQQIMGIFPYVVITSELIGVIWLGFLLFRKSGLSTKL